MDVGRTVRRPQSGLLRVGLLGLVGLVGLLALASPGRAGPEEDPVADPSGRWEEVRREALERLHDLARWCEGAQLFACREETYEAVLRLEPDDPVARKWLRYTRREDGTWVRDPQYRKPRNLERGEKDFRKRRAEVGAWLAGAVAPLLDAEGGPAAARLRGRVVQTALTVDPESPTFRSWNEEVRDDARGARGGKAPWILVETERARERRGALHRFARAAVEAVPAPTPGTLEEVDRRGGVEWPRVLQAAHVRVLGLPPEEELVQAIRHVEASWPFFAEALGRTPGPIAERTAYGRGFTMYVFEDRATGNPFLRAQPGVTERFLEFVTPMVSTWIPKRAALVVKGDTAEARLEAAPRQVVATMLGSVFGLGKHRAWITEALDIYLVWPIAGTRMIFTANDVERRYAEGERPLPEYEARLYDPSSDWYALGRMLLESPDKPDPFLMLGKDFNQITRLDVLYAWCVAAWLVEGRADQAAAFLTAVGGEGGNDLDAVCLDTFGFDARTMDGRIHRWLVETAAVGTR